jgi:hypothetical protein
VLLLAAKDEIWLVPPRCSCLEWASKQTIHGAGRGEEKEEALAGKSKGNKVGRGGRPTDTFCIAKELAEYLIDSPSVHQSRHYVPYAITVDSLREHKGRKRKRFDGQRQQ